MREQHEQASNHILLQLLLMHYVLCVIAAMFYSAIFYVYSHSMFYDLIALSINQLFIAYVLLSYIMCYCMFYGVILNVL